MSDKVLSVTTDTDMVENVGVAVGISTISHSVPEKHSTSGLESAILKHVVVWRRSMSDRVSSVTVDSGMAENVGEAVGISTISHSVPEKHSTSGLESAILKHVVGLRQAMSDKVGSITVDSGMAENVGETIGISVISHCVLEIQCTSGLTSTILNFGSPPTSYSNMH